MSAQRAQVVVVGGGFAGLYALRRLERLLPADAADLVLVSPSDHLVYSPLLPDVVASTLEPRHIAVSLRQALPRTRLVLGRALSADRTSRSVEVGPSERGREELVSSQQPWDRLLLAPGSVTRRFPIPGGVGAGPWGEDAHRGGVRARPPAHAARHRRLAATRAEL